MNLDKPLMHAIVAVIESGDEVLMVERAAIDTYPGYWNAVTGGLDDGEDQRAGCIREAFEEVGLEIIPVRKVWETITSRAHFVLHWWQCELAGPRDVTPNPEEVGDWQWVKRDAAHLLPLMFADSRWFFREIYPVTRRP